MPPVTVAQYLRPRSLPEALEAMDRHGPGVQTMAGGTIVMAMLNDGLIRPEVIVSLRQAGLDTIEATDDGVRIGATATLSRVLEAVDEPVLRDAIAHTGTWAIRNMATIGGNLLTPSPGGDVAVALLALDATVELVSRSGERTIPLVDLVGGDAAAARRQDELISAIHLLVNRDPAAFRKFGRKAANTPAVVMVAARVALDGDVVRDARIALGAAGPYPARARTAEAALVGQTLSAASIAATAAVAARDSDPPTDAIASAAYRRRMVELFVRRALTDLAAGGPS